MKSKGFKLLLVIALCFGLLLSACAKPAGTDLGATPAPAENPGDVQSTYSGSAQGFGGPVTVEIIVKNGSLADVTVQGDKETAGIGSNAVEALPERILQAGSVDIDTLTGATITSKAIIAAAREALISAGLADAVQTLTMKPGTYTATAQGFLGEVVVETTLTADSISAIRVTQSKDTPQIRVVSEDLLISRIVSAQALGVDVITGATVTGNAILSAVASCITQAGGDTAAISAPVKKSTATEEYQADVIVVGLGSSGSLAAASAAESGAKVIALEKSTKVGGTGALSSGPMAIGSARQKELGIEGTVKEVYRAWQDEVHYKANPTILQQFLTRSGETVDWLSTWFDWGEVIDWGIKTDRDGQPTTHLIHNLFPMAHKTVEHSRQTTVVYESFRNMLDVVQKNGGQILYETTGKELIFDKDGNAIGVAGQKYDGTTVHVYADKIILSTGGFAGDAELMRQEMQYAYRHYGLRQNTGEGFLMGLSAGGVRRNCAMGLSHFATTYGIMSGFDDFSNNIPFALLYTPGLLHVGPTGERFRSEDEMEVCTDSYTSFNLKQGEYYYALLTQQQVDILKQQGNAGLGSLAISDKISYTGRCAQPDEKMEKIEEVFAAGINAGWIFKGETLHELAQSTGMDEEVLTRNITRYNEACAAGVDAVFEKQPRYLNALEQGPYYAIKATPAIYCTLGGLDVNEFMQLLGETGRPVSNGNLYITGVDSIGVITDGVAYMDMGGPALGWAYYSGRTAGLHAAGKAKQ